MLHFAEGFRIDRSEPAHDRERGNLRLTRRCVARTSPAACVRSECTCEGERVCRAGVSCRSKPPPGDGLAALVLASAACI
jgi:hypothetical protein